jgi:hypothetical protein
MRHLLAREQLSQSRAQITHTSISHAKINSYQQIWCRPWDSHFRLLQTRLFALETWPYERVGAKQMGI